MAWIDLGELVAKCKDPDPLYIVYDIDGANNPPYHGVFTSHDEAVAAIDKMAHEYVEEILAAPVEETGVTEDDREWLIKDTRKSFAIQILHNGIDAIHYHCDIESPYA